MENFWNGPIGFRQHSINEHSTFLKFSSMAFTIDLFLITWCANSNAKVELNSPLVYRRSNYTILIDVHFNGFFLSISMVRMKFL